MYNNVEGPADQPASWHLDPPAAPPESLHRVDSYENDKICFFQKVKFF